MSQNTIFQTHTIFVNPSLELNWNTFQRNVPRVVDLTSVISFDIFQSIVFDLLSNLHRATISRCHFFLIIILLYWQKISSTSMWWVICVIMIRFCCFHTQRLQMIVLRVCIELMNWIWWLGIQTLHLQRLLNDGTRWI